VNKGSDDLSEVAAVSQSAETDRRHGVPFNGFKPFA
jgi:hypothetical protein